MSRRKWKRPVVNRDIAKEQFEAGYGIVERHPLFGALLDRAAVVRRDAGVVPAGGWAVVTPAGFVYVHPTRRGDPDVWVYVLAHCLLHLGFEHIRPGDRRPHEWNAAADCAVARFLANLKVGRPPAEIELPAGLPTQSEDDLYRRFCESGIPADLTALGTAGPRAADIVAEPGGEKPWRSRITWAEVFGRGLSRAVGSALNIAAGIQDDLGKEASPDSTAQRERSWFISSYPLLGALAASFRIIEDPLLCGRMDVSIAAVNVRTREIYLNPAAGLDQAECRFVMAHELLHVGLQHDARCRGRDHFLWNVACDYVINGWLVEMGVGAKPPGLLYDPDLKGWSAEAIYDRIATDMRRYRKLATCRGVGLGDILGGDGDFWQTSDGVDLDGFYRRCLAQGLRYHETGRGFLPDGLIEEIRALSQPPIPWDVELAAWFDAHFPPPEKIRSYARLSRRQSATPDIPRPRWTYAPGWEEGRTFGVVLDTSGSMGRALLGKALGTIASYAISREVPAVRVVFCDAATYDEGYLPPEAIADRVRIKGRGGTILQPAIDLLERADDFPKDGPLLVITDGACDRLRVRRDHAFLIPEKARLPFVPTGPVFRVK
jgi:predicted metal-dependent peptidase